MNEVGSKNFLSYNFFDVIVAFVAGGLAFLLAYRHVVLAVALTVFFMVLNLSRIDRNLKKIERELTVKKNAGCEDVESAEIR